MHHAPTLAVLSTLTSLAQIVIGFGLIIFIHELGHFLAARWAGIRVLAFAIGFGPATLSYRKGMGLRRGTSEPEYLARARTSGGLVPGVSPTEYRLNFLPLGGYVKMLGQEDLNPEATSSAPDSYQNAPVWKRMVVICAGVVMNLISAAALFVVIFMIGLPVEPARVGVVDPTAPAAMAVPLNAEALNISERGLQPGDEIIEINGVKPNKFGDIMVETAMAEPGTPVELVVKREGVASEVRFAIKPETGVISDLQELGIAPPHSVSLATTTDRALLERLKVEYDQSGIHDVPPGSVLVSIDGVPATSPRELEASAKAHPESPIEVVFEHPVTHAKQARSLLPQPELELDRVGPGLDDWSAKSDAEKRLAEGTVVIEHLLGLSPVLCISSMDEEGQARTGLRPGDIFARIGPIEYPRLDQGIREINANAGRMLDVVVLRASTPAVPGTPYTSHALAVKVSSEGRIGFHASTTAETSTLLARTPAQALDPRAKNAEPRALPAYDVLPPGSTILAVNEISVMNFGTLRSAIIEATASATGDASVSLRVLPVGTAIDPDPAPTSVTLMIPQADVLRLRALSYASPIPMHLFAMEQDLLKGKTPFEAIAIGMKETRSAMRSTYLTFVRLFQNSVKVKHLKGPIGIAQIGTIVADQGFMHLLRFLALISINLAVINFLPIPIVDGGQFLLLCAEKVRGKPVPASVQNALTMAGLVLIGAVFIVVTYNDVRNLFGM
ncbi:MAG: site-2 protease family protein [Phycisphaerales bacterium]